MADELRVHEVVLVVARRWPTRKGPVEARVAVAVSELVDGLARAVLDEVGGEGLEDLMGLHAYVGLAVLEDLQQHVLKVRVRDQRGEHADGDACDESEHQGSEEGEEKLLNNKENKKFHKKKNFKKKFFKKKTK